MNQKKNTKQELPLEVAAHFALTPEALGLLEALAKQLGEPQRPVQQCHELELPQ